MSSIPKRPRCSKKVKFEDSKDRISGLPDAILVHILSFLPTISGFATRVLSTRWRKIWASVPVLDFHDRSFPSYWDSHLECFVPYGLMNFVNKVLLFHDFSTLSKFRLQCCDRLGLGNLNAWITHAVNHLIQEIDLSIHTDGRCLYLPQSLCTSKTLVVLRLGHALQIQLPSSIWFPSLKILEISLFHLENNTTQKLLCSCPILEILIVEAFLTEGKEMVLNVVIPTLKRLTINLTVKEVPLDHDHKILLDTPSLEKLSLCDEYLGSYSVKNMSSLVTARVEIGQNRFEGDATDLANRIHDILKGLPAVKSLSLSFFDIRVLGHGDDKSLPMFYNLIHLDMHIQIQIVCPLLLKLFKRMPNLETLVITLDATDFEEDSSDEQFKSVALEEVPSCLLSHLKEFKVNRFGGRKDEMNLVKYLLQNSEILQKVTIGFEVFFYLYKSKKKIWKELLSCAKRSKTCQIQCC